MLIGPSLEYTGRCVCPEGYYKFGFTTTSCIKNEYVSEEWEKYKLTLNDLTNMDDIFPKYAFTIKEIDEDDAYTDYVIITFLFYKDKYFSF